MATKAEKQQTVKAETSQAQPGKAKPEKKFPLEKLRANCKKLFGVTDCTFAGATHGMTGNYTVDEIQVQLERWRGMEAK